MPLDGTADAANVWQEEEMQGKMDDQMDAAGDEMTGELEDAEGSPDAGGGGGGKGDLGKASVVD